MAEESNGFIGAADVGVRVILGMRWQSVCHVFENAIRTERIVRHRDGYVFSSLVFAEPRSERGEEFPSVGRNAQVV